MSRTLVALACLALSPLASAATFIVDTTSDAVLDTCDAGNPDHCSLRGAIGLANASADADTITFAIPETDPGYQSASAHWRIAPATAPPVPPSPEATTEHRWSQPCPDRSPEHFLSTQPRDTRP